MRAARISTREGTLAVAGVSYLDSGDNTIAEQLKSIDVRDSQGVLRLIEDVRRSGEPRVLQRAREDLAMVIPLPRTSKSQFKQSTAADLEAFRAAAGGWADLDTDSLIEDMYRAREERTRLDYRP